MSYIPIIVSIFALIISGLNFWFGFIRKIDPTFCCSRWTAFGITNSVQEGATFIVKIDINNASNHPVTIMDFIIIATTSKKDKILYEPILLWDLTYYIESMNVPKKIIEFQKGQIPLPVIIPAKQMYSFDYEILFKPKDPSVVIINNQDAPFNLQLLALTDRWKNYKVVVNQEFHESDIVNLTQGNFSGVLSTVSITNRKKIDMN